MGSIALRSLGFGALLLFSACASRDLRPGFLNSSEILRREWAFPVEPASSQLPLGGMEYVSPVLYDQTLIFGSSRFGLIAIYPKIKRVRWKLELPNGILSPLAVDRDHGYFTGGDGRLYAISLESGKTLWTYDLRNPVTSKPVVSGDELFVTTSDDVLVCLDARSGKWQWHYRRRNASGPVVHGASTPLPVGDSVWVGFADGALASVSRKDGKVLWEKQLNTNKRFSGLNAGFLEKDGLVYVPAYDQALFALNASTGSTVWVREGAGGSSKVSISGDVLYASGSDGRLRALDPKSGKDFWSFELDDGVPSEVIETGNQVIFSSTHEFLYVLDKADGRLRNRFHAGHRSGFSGGMAFDSGTRKLYALSRGGNLYSFHVSPDR